MIEGAGDPAQPGHAGAATRAELMSGDGWCMYAGANFERLVLGFVKAEFCIWIVSKIVFQHY